MYWKLCKGFEGVETYGKFSVKKCFVKYKRQLVVRRRLVNRLDDFKVSRILCRRCEHDLFLGPVPHTSLSGRGKDFFTNY